MIEKIKAILFSGMFLSFCLSCNEHNIDFPLNKVLPEKKQLEYQKMELIGFIHFGINTYYERGRGDGKEDPRKFNPVQLDCRQWVRIAKEAGMKQLIITAKHHDGFCLWPTETTDFSVESTSWQNGKGDVLKEMSHACKDYGLKFGVYISPWDMNHPTYGTPEYNDIYKKQIEEIMTRYSPVSELWMDGAKDPKYPDMDYDFEGFRKLAYDINPELVIFSDAGPDIRWIGNENGIAGETCWSTIDNEKIIIGKAPKISLNRGEEDGNRWVVPEADVPMRREWFYIPEDEPKTPQHLTDIFYTTIGRNATMLLNLSPNKDGLIDYKDEAILKEFRSILDETFNENLALNSGVTVSSSWSNSADFDAQNITDADVETFWAPEKLKLPETIEVNLQREVIFDRIMLQEPIWLGQRISAFDIDFLINGKWERLDGGTTIGYKKLLKFNPVKANKIRLIITNANNVPAISNFAVFKASTREYVTDFIYLKEKYNLKYNDL